MSPSRQPSVKSLGSLSSAIARKKATIRSSGSCSSSDSSGPYVSSIDCQYSSSTATTKASLLGK